MHRDPSTTSGDSALTLLESAPISKLQHQADIAVLAVLLLRRFRSHLGLPVYGPFLPVSRMVVSDTPTITHWPTFAELYICVEEYTQCTQGDPMETPSSTAGLRKVLTRLTTQGWITEIPSPSHSEIRRISLMGFSSPERVCVLLRRITALHDIPALEEMVTYISSRSIREYFRRSGHPRPCDLDQHSPHSITHNSDSETEDSDASDLFGDTLDD